MCALPVSAFVASQTAVEGMDFIFEIIYIFTEF